MCGTYLEKDKMLKNRPVASLHKPSSNSKYFHQNLIQTNLALIGTKNLSAKNNNIPSIKDINKTSEEPTIKSKKVQQLAEEVANLLIEEQTLVTEVEKGCKL